MVFKGGWDTRFSRSQEHGSVWGSGVAERKRGPSASSQTAGEEGPPGKSPAWKGTRFLRFLPGEALRGFSPCVPGRGTVPEEGTERELRPKALPSPSAPPHIFRRGESDSVRELGFPSEPFSFLYSFFFLFFSIFFFKPQLRCIQRGAEGRQRGLFQGCGLGSPRLPYRNHQGRTPPPKKSTSPRPPPWPSLAAAGPPWNRPRPPKCAPGKRQRREPEPERPAVAARLAAKGCAERGDPRLSGAADRIAPPPCSKPPRPGCGRGFGPLSPAFKWQEGCPEPLGGKAGGQRGLQGSLLASGAGGNA